MVILFFVTMIIVALVTKILTFNIKIKNAIFKFLGIDNKILLFSLLAFLAIISESCILVKYDSNTNIGVLDTLQGYEGYFIDILKGLI